MEIEPLFDFMKLTHSFQQVQRVVRANGEDRWENDAEHTCQLALVGWYLIEQYKLDLDVRRVLLYSLAHDLVEVYAGDTYIYDEKTVLALKKEREEKAQELLRENYPGFTSLHNIIAEYETRKFPESRFVYALDKLLPILNIYLDDGRTWKEKTITLDQLIENKTDKIAISPEIVPFYKEIIAILRQKPELFVKNFPL